MGTVSGSFIVPNNDAIKIATGTREFKILDISADDDKNAGSVASAPYTAKGFLDTKQAEYESTRIIYMPYSYHDHQDGSHDNRGSFGYTSTDGGNSWTSNRNGSFSFSSTGFDAISQALDMEDEAEGDRGDPSGPDYGGMEDGD